jgi:hypothetical protein
VVKKAGVEVHCDNRQAHFIPWYGTEESADTETLGVEKCSLYGGDPFKRDNLRTAACG